MEAGARRRLPAALRVGLDVRPELTSFLNDAYLVIRPFPPLVGGPEEGETDAAACHQAGGREIDVVDAEARIDRLGIGARRPAVPAPVDPRRRKGLEAETGAGRHGAAFVVEAP